MQLWEGGQRGAFEKGAGPVKAARCSELAVLMGGHGNGHVEGCTVDGGTRNWGSAKNVRENIAETLE